MDQDTEKKLTMLLHIHSQLLKDPAKTHNKYRKNRKFFYNLIGCEKWTDLAEKFPKMFYVNENRLYAKNIFVEDDDEDNTPLSETHSIPKAYATRQEIRNENPDLLIVNYIHFQLIRDEDQFDQFIGRWNSELARLGCSNLIDLASLFPQKFFVDGNRLCSRLKPESVRDSVELKRLLRLPNNEGINNSSLIKLLIQLVFQALHCECGDIIKAVDLADKIRIHCGKYITREMEKLGGAENLIKDVCEKSPEVFTCNYTYPDRQMFIALQWFFRKNASVHGAYMQRLRMSRENPSITIEDNSSAEVNEIRELEKDQRRRRFSLINHIQFVVIFLLVPLIMMLRP